MSFAISGTSIKDPGVAFRYIHLADAHKRRVSQDINARLGEWLGASGGG